MASEILAGGELIPQLIADGAIGAACLYWLITQGISKWQARQADPKPAEGPKVCALIDGGITPPKIGQLEQQWRDHLEGQDRQTDLTRELIQEVKGLRSDLKHYASQDEPPIRDVG